MFNFLKKLGCCIRKPPSQKVSILLTMPDLVMKEVLGNLDIMETLKLRKVCRALRDFVDENADLHLYELQIIEDENSVELNLRANKEISRTRYEEMENGCLVVYATNEDYHDHLEEEKKKMKKKLLKSENYLDLMFIDLVIALRLQKSALVLLEVKFNDPGSCPEFASKLHKIMATRNLKTKWFNITVSNSDQVMRILPHLDTKTLVSIQIQCTQTVFRQPGSEGKYLNLDRIVELKQWKEAERIGIVEHFVKKQDFEHIKHAKEIDVTLECLEYEDLVEWKENLLRHPHIKKVNLLYCFLNTENFDDLFGPTDYAITFIPRAKCCFKIPNSDEVIRITWENYPPFFSLEREIFDRKKRYNLIHEVPL